MGRTLDQVLSGLTVERRERVEARFQELKDEVEGLGELRRAAGKAQAEIAENLRIKQPSVSKIEKQADMYLSTLRNYVEAIGGKLDLIVRLPSGQRVRLERLGDVAEGRATRHIANRTIAHGRARAKSRAQVG